MASVRKRTWTHNGQKKTAWTVDYKDREGRRHQPQFEKQKEAQAHLDKVKRELFEAVRVPENRTIGACCSTTSRCGKQGGCCSGMRTSNRTAARTRRDNAFGKRGWIRRAPCIALGVETSSGCIGRTKVGGSARERGMAAMGRSGWRCVKASAETNQFHPVGLVVELGGIRTAQSTS